MKRKLSGENEKIEYQEIWDLLNELKMEGYYKEVVKEFKNKEELVDLKEEDLIKLNMNEMERKKLMLMASIWNDTKGEESERYFKQICSIELELTESLLENQKYKTQIEENYFSIFKEACKLGSLEIIKLLYLKREKFISPYQQISFINIALFVASINGKEDVVHFLLSKGNFFFF